MDKLSLKSAGVIVFVITTLTILLKSFGKSNEIIDEKLLILAMVIIGVFILGFYFKNQNKNT